MNSPSSLENRDKKINQSHTVVVNKAYFPPEDPSLVFRIKAYILMACIITPAIQIFMKVLNRTRITGIENIKKQNSKWILASNHLSILDDLFLCPILLFPKSMRGYSQFPYHTPEERNFYKNRLTASFMRHTKSVPLIRGAGIYQPGINRIIKSVGEGGLLHIFPEGTRSRSGKIGSGKAGIGRIVCESNATVIPVYHQGLEGVLPIGTSIPRIGKDIRIAVGEPMNFETDIELGEEIPKWKSISREITMAIDKQRIVSEDKWGPKALYIKARK
ncbi:MAG: 1-acyl-sn-glycerol-3-phosphate acyltransferase [Calditrichaeota bacterium]|nr:1-acyl-sn-glycerol-3-phosphate acyltransferase [Calditrichota bacterium]MBT7787920.1 1-acyl-sn-glycerol-3-phosphate acyltransferase [Calditrichota bacterium]